MLLSLNNFLFLILGFTAYHGASASPITSFYNPDNGTAYHEVRSLETRQSSGGRTSLRIMPLGASITQGWTSVPENGYRRKLREHLRFIGHEVDMIGCRSSGDFNDRQHEGHPGDKVGDMIGYASCSIDQLPNVILLHVGTNDCTGAGDDEAGRQYIRDLEKKFTDLISYLYTHSEGVTIVLSTLLPNENPVGNTNVNTLNDILRNIVNNLAPTNKMVLAEMGNNYIPLSQLVDGTHPNLDGYAKMASVFAAAIDMAESLELISPPLDNGRGDSGHKDDKDSQCAPTPPSPDHFSDPVKTQRGSGDQDGTYTHASEAMKSFGDFSFPDLALDAPSLVDHIHFAQLVNLNNLDKGGETDEMIFVADSFGGEPENRNIWFKTNRGGSFEKTLPLFEGPIDVKIRCTNQGIRWGDINGDGLDDFICLRYPSGDMYVAINQGGNPPTFKDVGLIKPALSWAPQERIRLGDIDGDGRLDYCVIDEHGDIFCWRNGGTGLPIESDGGYWQGMVGDAPTFDHKGMPGIEGVRFVDINGDGRADWVYVFPDGHTEIYINQRGTKEDGKGLKPAWIKAANGHYGFPGVAGLNRDNFKFGRLFGTGRADFIKITEHLEDSIFPHVHTMEVWKNIGAGGTKVKGDGVRYCDMFGRGYDDYLWVYSTGAIHLYENTQDLPNWRGHGEIFNTGMDRKSIQFGDWDGDGLCDILHVDRHTGIVQMFKNTYDPKKSQVPTFASPIVVTDALCSEGWGIGLYDLGLRFADLDGDGRVDYLCMEKNGRTTGYLNTKNGMVNVHQIKFAEPLLDRANLRWADVNGDGKADFLWVDKFTGNVRLWLNGGQIPTGGSSFFWNNQGDIWMAGVDRGANMHFPKLGKLGRADFHRVLPKTAEAWTYYNQCNKGGETGGDDGVITDPKLPPLLGGGNELCKRAGPDFICDAEKEFPKVAWRHSQDFCTEDQLKIIYRAHKQAIKMMEYNVGLDASFGTAGWNRYFVSDPAWRNGALGDKLRMADEKYKNVLAWAKGSLTAKEEADLKPRKFKTTYYCKSPVFITDAADRCENRYGTGGKTITIRGGEGTGDRECGTCASIVLCEIFWTLLPHMDDIPLSTWEELPYSTENVEGRKEMKSREQTLIHEWFHIPQTSKGEKPSQWKEDAYIDVIDTVGLAQGKIYGPGRASRWAWWRFEQNNSGDLQQDALRNADSLSWLVTYNWMAHIWGWNHDGRWEYKWLSDKEKNNEKEAGVSYYGRYKRWMGGGKALVDRALSVLGRGWKI